MFLNAEECAASAFLTSLAKAHTSLCPWNEFVSPIEFTTLPSSPVDAVQAIEGRAIRLHDSAWDRVIMAPTFMTEWNTVVEATLGRTSDVAWKVQNHSKLHLIKLTRQGLLLIYDEYVGDVEVQNAVILSVCGWTIGTIASSPSPSLDRPSSLTDSDFVHCSFCCRSLNVAHYATNPDIPVSSSDSPVSSFSTTADHGTKRKRIDVDRNDTYASSRPFDPIREHRPFCPYLTPASTSSNETNQTETEIGWKYMCKLWCSHLAPVHTPPNASPSSSLSASISSPTNASPPSPLHVATSTLSKLRQLVWLSS